MIKSYDTLELAQIISRRSICKVKVGCVIYDSHGIFAWGWNHVGAGYGMCAEQHAIKRANKRRLERATILIYSERRSKEICSLPCIKCMKLIVANRIIHIDYKDSFGNRHGISRQVLNDVLVGFNSVSN